MDNLQAEVIPRTKKFLFMWNAYTHFLHGYRLIMHSRTVSGFAKVEVYSYFLVSLRTTWNNCRMLMLEHSRTK